MSTISNKAHLIGNLTDDPEIRIIESGQKHARFEIAVEKTYKNDKGKEVKETQWHRIVAWGEQAEIAGNLLKKGEQAAIGGILVNRNYIDKEGIKRCITEIHADEILKLGGKNSG